MSQERFDRVHGDLPGHVYLHPELQLRKGTRDFALWWVGTYLSPVLVVGFTLVWCLLIYFLIRDRSGSRDWQYGVVPYVPAESIESTAPTPTGRAPLQVEYPTKQRRRMNGM